MQHSRAESDWELGLGLGIRVSLPGNGSRRAQPLLFLPWLLGLVLCIAAVRGDSLAPAPTPEEIQSLEASSAKHPEDPGILLLLGQAYHDAAAANQKDAAAKSEKALRRVLSLNPTNAVARAYFGSALTLRARDAVFPPTKLSLAREGFREMDAAVAQGPDSVQSRLIRGLNSVSVPKIFDRLKLAEEDLGWIHEQTFHEGDYGGRPMRQRVALEYGRILSRLKNTDKARKVWQVGLELDPGSPLADRLRSELKTSGKP